ncbi:MAG: IS66 family transposase zinc-finger binding domain-containing protein [Ardenticatenia bacterium]|nr:IS66 family transposase zinc-finger binding domain-containing protein [Ardenticatenia bacterium]
MPCMPGTCGCCGETLEGMDPTPERHQQVDIPEPKVLVTEYQIHRLTCSRCGQVTAGELPAGVSRSRFGPRTHGMVVLLTGQWLLSKRMAALLLEPGFRPGAEPWDDQRNGTADGRSLGSAGGRGS